MTAPPLRWQPQLHALRAGFAGTTVGCVGLALLEALNIAMAWLYGAAHRQGRSWLAAELVVGHSLAAALFGFLAAALLAGQWRRQAQVVHGRVLPAAQRQMARALRSTLVAISALAALPAACSVLLRLAGDAVFLVVHQRVVHEVDVPTSLLLLHALAVPTAGIVLGACTVLLGPSRWRWLFNLLPMALVAFPWLNANLAVPASMVVPVIAWTTLLAAVIVWVLGRRLWAVADQAPAPRMLQTSPRPAAAPEPAPHPHALPQRLAALVLPDAGGWTSHVAFGAAQCVLVAAFVAWTGLRWGGALLVVCCVMTNAVAPWIAGVWVARRLPCLPGAPRREQLWRFVLLHTWRRGLPRLALTAVPLLVLCAVRGAPAADVGALAVLMLSTAVWVSACAVAAPAVGLGSAGFGWTPWVALSAMPALLGALLLQQPAGPGALALPALQASVVACAAGVAVLLAARSAWTRVDWSRIPAQQWPVHLPSQATRLKP